jgi:putative transposase
MKKTFEYRLYPTRRQRELLMLCLIDSRHLYNEMLEVVRKHYEQTGEFLFKYELCSLFKGRGGDHVPASTVQAVADRLDKALKRFLRARQSGRKCGFPRFKSANRWHSVRLRQYGRDVFLDPETKRLKVPRKLGGPIKVKQHRPLQGEPKTAHLVLRADGHWYVLVVCDLGERPEAKEGEAIGLDVGLKSFVADSEGNTVENPRCYRRLKKRLRRTQRKACRRKKGSKRRRKAAREAAKLHLKVARQRKDFLHKLARRYVDRYAEIAIEDLNVSGMVKNPHLALSIHDAAWSSFVQMLESKAEEAGSRVSRISPRHTTQRCSRPGCGELVAKTLSVRTHACPSCGHVEDRDVNAARNILAEARTGPSERNVGGCPGRAPRSRRP